MMFRLWLAGKLCPNTHVLTTSAALSALMAESVELYAYVHNSGALNDPSRIKAYRRILYAVNNLWMLADAAAFGGRAATLPPISDEEEMSA